MDSSLAHTGRFADGCVLYRKSYKKLCIGNPMKKLCIGNPIHNPNVEIFKLSDVIAWQRNSSPSPCPHKSYSFSNYRLL